MARSLVAFALISLLPAPLALAEASSPSPTPSATPGPSASPNPTVCPKPGASPKSAPGTAKSLPDRSGKDRPGGDSKRPPFDEDGSLKRFRDRFEHMAPEEREQFRKNWQRWKEMGDRERKNWKQRAAEEHERVKKTIDDAVAKIGLKLSEDQKEVFAVRYRQERRKIEEQLRKEMDAERQQRIDEMLANLKAEFSAPKAPATPAPSPTTP